MSENDKIWDEYCELRDSLNLDQSKIFDQREKDLEKSLGHHPNYIISGMWGLLSAYLLGIVLLFFPSIQVEAMTNQFKLIVFGGIVALIHFLITKNNWNQHYIGCCSIMRGIKQGIQEDD
tara:strand:- start:19 stop:378 length:360 start_codon:yes stop_codon:yes gene_type:complete